MTQLTIQQALELALQHHTRGDLATAENIYRQILAVDPNNVDGWNNLGVALQQSRRLTPPVFGCRANFSGESIGQNREELRRQGRLARGAWCVD